MKSPPIIPSPALLFVLLWMPIAAAAQPVTTTSTNAPSSGILLRRTFEAYQSGNYLAAPGLLAQVLAKTQAEGDLHGEAVVRLAHAFVFQKLGMVPLASEHEAKARALLETSADKALVSRVWSVMGWCYSKIGQTARVTESLTLALKLGQESDDPVALGLAHVILAKHLRDGLGQREAALKHYHEAIRHWERTADARGQALAHFQLAGYYSMSFQLESVLESGKRARMLLANTPARQPAARLLDQFRGIFTDETELGIRLSQTLGHTLFRLGQLEAAEAEYATGVKLARQAGLAYAHASILGGLADMQRELGRAAAAEGAYTEVLAVARQAGNRQSEAHALRGLAYIALSRNETAKARQLGSESLQVNRDSGHTGDSVLLHQLFADSYRIERNDPAALTNSLAAIEAAERTREAFGDLTESKLNFQAGRAYVYASAIDTLLRLNRHQEAFDLVERAKGRTLLDLLTHGKANLTRGLKPEDRRQEEQLRQRVQQAHHALTAEKLETAPAAARLTSLDSQLDKAERDFRNFSERLLTQQPDLALRRSARPLKLEELGPVLPADTALVNIWAPNPNYVDIHVVTVAEGKLTQRHHRAHRPAGEIAELIQDFAESCADPKRGYRSKARELHQFLLGNFAPELAGKHRLVICPDGAFWGVPFQALLKKDGTTEQHLGERFEITYAYSATALAASLQAATATNRVKSSALLLVVANPDFGGAARFTGAASKDDRAIGAEARALGAEARAVGAEARAVTGRDGGITSLPGTQREAEAIRAFFPAAKLLTGAQAQEATVKAEAGKHRYLHFATHGLFSESSPLTSSIVLAQPTDPAKEDGFLTAREIFEQSWSADLVVFSACDTGRGKRLKGEGVVGLTWAAFVAGVPSQVVSQWAVNDASTAQLMAAFYQHLKAGKGRGAALQAAGLELLKDGTHNHPYYWAPFTLLGDWRN